MFKTVTITKKVCIEASKMKRGYKKEMFEILKTNFNNKMIDNVFITSVDAVTNWGDMKIVENYCDCIVSLNVTAYSVDIEDEIDIIVSQITNIGIYGYDKTAGKDVALYFIPGDQLIDEITRGCSIQVKIRGIKREKIFVCVGDFIKLSNSS
jgi:DNA-directed RNA polymerase subunit E'/Rpb7